MGAYATYLAWAGLVCVLAYTLGQWREIAKVFSRRQARYGTLAGVSILVVLGILIAINYIGARQNKRWDLTANQQFSLSDQSRNVVVEAGLAAADPGVCAGTEFQTFRDKLKEYRVRVEEGLNRVHRPRQEADDRAAESDSAVRHHRVRLQGPHRARHHQTPNRNLTNAIIKVVSGQQRKIYFTQGHGEKDTASSERDGYNAIAAALGRENYAIDKLVIAQAGAVPDDASIVIVAGPRIDFFPPEIDALKNYLGKNGKLLLQIDPPDKPDSPPLTNLIALAHDWGIDVGNDIVVDASGMGRLIGTDASVPVVANYPPHAITERFNFLTAFPLARSVTPVMGGVNGHTAQTFSRPVPELGGDRHPAAC